MKFFRSYKLSKKTKYLIVAGAVAAYFLGFSSRAYSPAHIGRYAIPIPTLIPVIQSLSADTNTSNPGDTNGLPAANTLNEALVFSHTNIITTFFWVGEPADADNGYIANSASAWDEQWKTHFGGEDVPSPRNGYNPAAFLPKENPFYFALPYSDLTNGGKRKNSAVNCPLASQKSNYSWCKNSWLAIRHNGKVAYAQWEDVGPFEEDDIAYVFGAVLPKNKQDAKAGLDVSPAVKDYLGLDDVDKSDWAFVDSSKIPAGPWKDIITSNPGSTVN